MTEAEETSTDELYAKQYLTLSNSIGDALRISLVTKGIQTDGTQLFWASVLFTRLLVTALSILKLSPDLARPKNNDSHWDYSSVSSLTRNLAETYFMFFYLCIDKTKDHDEWLTRLNLIQLRDHVSRKKMLREWAADNEIDIEADYVLEDLLTKIKSRKHFQTLPQKTQMDLLKGEKAVLFSQDILLLKMGKNANEFRGIWRYLSAHTHSMPMSFIRMAEDGRGCGNENDVEKSIMCGVLEMASSFVSQASENMRHLFPKETSS